MTDVAAITKEERLTLAYRALAQQYILSGPSMPDLKGSAAQSIFVDFQAALTALKKELDEMREALRMTREELND